MGLVKNTIISTNTIINSKWREKHIMTNNMNDKIVLICATGRSGSTTLMRIINTIPNSNISGENDGAINKLLEFYAKIHNIYGWQDYEPAPYEQLISQNIKPAWYNCYRLPVMDDHIRGTIIAMFKNSPLINLWGYKEIRYDMGNINLIKHFKKLFPQTKVIVQIREDINAQSKSSWYKNDTKSILVLEQYNKDLIKFYNENKSYCHFITFEKMFDMANLKSMFEFIDCNEYFDEEKIKQILSNSMEDKKP